MCHVHSPLLLHPRYSQLIRQSRAVLRSTPPALFAIKKERIPRRPRHCVQREGREERWRRWRVSRSILDPTDSMWASTLRMRSDDVRAHDIAGNSVTFSYSTIVIAAMIRLAFKYVSFPFIFSRFSARIEYWLRLRSYFLRSSHTRSSFLFSASLSCCSSLLRLIHVRFASLPPWWPTRCAHRCIVP